MSTTESGHKVQQGPHLKAAIAALPARSSSKLNRECLAEASPGDVAAAIQDRLMNDLVHYVDVIVAASENQREAYVQGVETGIYVIGQDLQTEFAQIASLARAIWADEIGLEPQP